jgi:diphthamide synthase subunit DPH2
VQHGSKYTHVFPFYVLLSFCRTWLRGSTNNVAVMRNTRRVFNPTSTPGSRYASAAAVDVNTGNLILWGGGGCFPACGDLFAYSPMLNQWQYLAGNSTSLAEAVFSQGKNVPVPGNSTAAGIRSGAMRSGLFLCARATQCGE